MKINRPSAKAGFTEWSSLFSGTLFVKLAAYIDESGRHDKTGRRQGSGQIVVAGWVDWRDHWADFCQKWQTVLDKYQVPYFHFYEWAAASAVARKAREPSSSFSKNPYQLLTLEKLDDLLYELAELAGGGNKMFVGGYVSTEDFHEAKNHPDFQKFPRTHDDPYHACLHDFFRNFSMEVQQQWPFWTEPVAFFFDHNDDVEWNRAVQTAFAAAKKLDPRIAELTFADMKVFPHFPLQAADMLAYRMRQIVGKFIDPTIVPNPSKLDDYLIKPSIINTSSEAFKGMLSDFSSALPLRYGAYPWRKKK